MRLGDTDSVRDVSGVCEGGEEVGTIMNQKTKKLIISGQKQVEMFADAIEASANDRTPRQLMKSGKVFFRNLAICFS